MKEINYYVLLEGNVVIRRRVCIYIPWGMTTKGGVNTVIKNILAEDKKSKHQKALILNRSDDKNFSEIHNDDHILAKCFLIPFSSVEQSSYIFIKCLVQIPKFILSFRKVVKKYELNNINSHFLDTDSASFIIYKLICNPSFRVAVSFHGSDVENYKKSTGLQKKLYNFILEHSDNIIFCSNYLRGSFQTITQKHTTKSVVIVNGINSEAISSDAEKATQPKPLSSPYILCIAGYSHVKGQDILLEAFHSVAKKHPHNLIFIGGLGSKKTLETLKHSSKLLQLEGRISFYVDLPHHSTMAILSQASILILPSRLESFGLVILEAGLHGIPVIASNVGGIPDIIEDGINGTLVPSENVGSIIKAIDKLLGNEAYSLKTARNLKMDVENNYNWKKGYRQYCKIWF